MGICRSNWGIDGYQQRAQSVSFDYTAVRCSAAVPASQDSLF